MIFLDFDTYVAVKRNRTINDVKKLITLIKKDIQTSQAVNMPTPHKYLVFNSHETMDWFVPWVDP